MLRLPSDSRQADRAMSTERDANLRGVVYEIKVDAESRSGYAEACGDCPPYAIVSRKQRKLVEGEVVKIPLH